MRLSTKKRYLKDLNRFTIVIFLMVSELLGLFDLEDNAKKIAPYYAIFSFGILMYIKGFSLSLFILTFIAGIFSVLTIFIKTNENILDITKLIITKEENLDLAKKVGLQPAKGFILRGILVGFTFILFLISFIYIIISFISNSSNILLLIFFILGTFIFLFSVIFTLIKSKRILKTPKIIKEAIKN